MKVKSFKITVLLVLVVLVSISLASCGKKEKKFTIWAEAIGSKSSVLDSYVKYFNENSNLGVEMQYEMKENLSGDLRTAIQSYSAPDLVIWPRWETVSKKNLLTDLTSKIGSSSVKLDDYHPEVRKELEMDGKIYGIATDVDAWGLWCNMDIFNASNITKLPETWAELKTTATTLTTGSGASLVAGIDTHGLRGQFYTLMSTAGVDYVKPGNPATIDIDINDKNSASYKATYDVMSLMKDLYALNIPESYGQVEYMTNNKVAMKFGPSNMKSAIKEVTGVDMNIKFTGNPAKSATEGQISGILGGYSLAIPKGVDIDNSWKALEWMLSAESMTKYCEAYELLPANQKLWDAEYISKSETLTTMSNILPTYKVRPIIKGYSNLESAVVFSVMDELRLGTKTIEQAITYLKTHGDDLLQLESMI